MHNLFVLDVGIINQEKAVLLLNIRLGLIRSKTSKI